MTLKISTIGRVLIAVLLAMMSLVVMSYFITSTNVNTIKESWDRFETTRSEKARALNVLSREIGYGGMIHQFKNYVLRGDSALIRKAQSHMIGARSAIDSYKLFDLDPDEASALREIRAMLDSYEYSLRVARGLVAERKGIQAIDQQVRVNDQSALRALTLLSRKAQPHITSSEDHTTKPLLLNAIRRELGYGGMIHNFKNFIIRGDDSLVPALVRNVGKIKGLLVDYKNFTLNENERLALSQIEKVLQQYVDGLGLAVAAHDGGVLPLRIDAAVRVSDAPALSSINVLSREIFKDEELSARSVAGALDLVENILKTQFFAVLMLILSLIFVVGWMIRSQVVRPVTRLTQAMNQLAAGDFGISIPAVKQQNEIGEMSRALSVFRDAAVQQQADKDSLIESEHRLRLLFESSPIGVSLVSLTTNERLYANPMLVKMFGAETEEQFNAMPIIDSYADPDDFQKARAVHKEEAMPTVEVLRKRVDGSTWWSMVTRRRINMDGDDCLIIWYFDITERRAYEQALVESTEVAENASRAKSDFLSSMSHELRTPMNAILGFAQMLNFYPDEPLTENQKDAVDHILKGGNHLLELIDQVLELNKIEAGKLSVNVEHVPARLVIDECLDLIRGRADTDGIKIVDRTGGDDLPILWTDRTRLKQVLINLLSNAVKYNRQGGSVILECQETPDHMLRISVADSGKGIPAEKQKNLFLPFERLGRETGDIEGTGIGLTITKQIVELLGGQVGFESVEDEGSTFWVDIPMRFSQEAPEKETRSLENVAKSTPQQTDGERARTILYVEDNPENMRLMETIVSRLVNTNLLGAQNAEQGLDIAVSKKPDLILMDINLPGMNGIDALARLRGIEETKDIPIIAVTAAALTQDREAGDQAGFSDYITKPVNVREVIQAIEAALNPAKVSP